jgi:hypothetical protein
MLIKLVVIILVNILFILVNGSAQTQTDPAFSNINSFFSIYDRLLLRFKDLSGLTASNLEKFNLFVFETHTLTLCLNINQQNGYK